MANDIVDPTKGAFASFKDRITSDINKRSGDLMGDDVVAEIVSDALKKIVEDGMREETSGYNRAPEGWLRKAVREAYAEEAQRQMKQWVSNNPALFQELITGVFALKGPEIIARAIAEAGKDIAYSGAVQGQQMTLETLRNAGVNL